MLERFIHKGTTMDHEALYCFNCGGKGLDRQIYLHVGNDSYEVECSNCNAVHLVKPKTQKYRYQGVVIKEGNDPITPFLYSYRAKVDEKSDFVKFDDIRVYKNQNKVINNICKQLGVEDV